MNIKGKVHQSKVKAERLSTSSTVSLCISQDWFTPEAKSERLSSAVSLYKV